MFDIPFDTQTFYSIRSVYKSPKQAISLGLLPCREAPTRTFNVIRLPNHDIWKIKDGKELRNWFAKAFPRFDFSAESSLVEPEEFDRFATTEGLNLPPCQYSPNLYVVSPNAEAAVMLVGDSVHTFPPDLGEGVNSGLEDVLCLDESLTKFPKIGDAARYYGSLREPEVCTNWVAQVGDFTARVYCSNSPFIRFGCTR
jgi:kynurenine 3-monooxygenase